MAFLILCPACLQRLELPELDENLLAANGGNLCTCTKCNVQLTRDDHGRVVAADARSCGFFAIPEATSRAIVRREGGGRVLLRARGWFKWLFAKRVIVTNEQVEIRLPIRPRVRRVIPIEHAHGVVIIQIVFLNPASSLWATHLLFDELWAPLAAFTNVDHAIDHASAINRALFAHKPAADPYRGTLPKML